ncbi:MAG: TM0106 family RecB-like putative nuclease [Proteobacteria bacterium]|nr:TM0106 family RecB-like putative nuclease [Pseudomonadota bacterium]
MRLVDGNLFFAPSDLISYMESALASHMERHRLVAPAISELINQEDPLLKTLQQKGFDHEDAFLVSLKAEGKTVVEIERASQEVMLTQTREAMADGADIIAQAYLQLYNFGGMADFLVKISGASRLGDFHYEVWDTKLSKKMKPYFAIQLCCYAEMLESEQGVRPQNVAIVLGNNEITPLRVQDYFGYYSALKASFLQFHNGWGPDKLPDPADSISHGRWSQYAGRLLEERRHLSLVANITRTQIKRLEASGVSTIDELSVTKLRSIPKLNSDIFDRLKAQAEIQIGSEGVEKPLYKVLPHEPGRALGLALLPHHSASDVFFDIEGFPLIDGGLEYLWGATYFDEKGKRTFRDFWAHDQAEEKQAFTDFVDWVFDRWRQDPSMHIYHYASYEVTALRRLMGRYGVREHQVDTLLRNEVFVDLYTVVRHGVLVGEPSYSIKNVEHIYRGKRDTDVASGSESVVVYEEWRANPDGMTWEVSPVLRAIRDYNIDDCNSTQELAEWLMSEQSANGIDYVGDTPNESTEEDEEETEVTRLRDKLLGMAELEPDEEKQSVLRNLAWLLEFHKRENKPTWWRLFDRLGLTEVDLHDDMDCLVGIQRTAKEPFLPSARARNKVYEYAFDPNQPFKGQARRFYVLGEDNVKVSCIDYDPEQGLICLQSKTEPADRLSLVPDEYVNPLPIPTAVQDVIEKLLVSDFSQSAIVDFLFRKKPNFTDGRKDLIIASDLEGPAFINSVISAASALKDSYLCIQGPPGAGKTFTARHIIGALLDRGKRVGISSNSHKAITNLMSGVADHVLENGIEATLIKVGGDEDDPIFDKPNVHHRKNATSSQGDLNKKSLCVGGTAWLFCNDVMSPDKGFEKFDYLFVDEAGQVSLANLVGMSRSAKNIILAGDQMQLGQPTQGSHPDQSGQSVLEYLLQGQATIAPDMGVFLPKSYRMHPDVCTLISNQVYDGRLKSDDCTLTHEVGVPNEILPIQSGVHFVPVIHEGNTQGSDEEAKVITDLANSLIGLPFWPVAEGSTDRIISWTDILFVAPYNYQVNLLRAALGSEARVGSVDKFQGQEAPIVFISMCASDASESPRGIDFLFSKNRLNVAISRAEALAIVVGSPNLATTPVSNLRQMELVNFYSEIVRYGS